MADDAVILDYIIKAQDQAKGLLQQQVQLLQQLSTGMSALAANQAKSVQSATAAATAARTQGDSLDRLINLHQRLNEANQRTIRGFAAMNTSLQQGARLNAIQVSWLNSLSTAVTKNTGFMQQHGQAWQNFMGQVRVGATVTPQFAQTLQGLGQQFQNTVNGTTQASSGLQSMGAAATAVSAAIGALSATVLRTFVGAMEDAVKQASLFQATFKGLGTIAKSFGQDIDATTQAAKDLAADGLMSVRDTALTLKNLIASGFNLEQAINLAKGFKDIASFNRQASMELGYAVTSASEGIKNQNSLLVDNAGLTKNLTIILKEMGLSEQDLGKVQSDVNVRTKLYSGLLKEMGQASGDAARYTDTFAGSQSALAVQIQLLEVAIGDNLLPALTKINVMFSETIQFLRGGNGAWADVARAVAIAGTAFVVITATLATLAGTLGAVVGAIGLLEAPLAAVGLTVGGLVLTLTGIAGVLALVTTAFIVFRDTQGSAAAEAEKHTKALDTQRQGLERYREELEAIKKARAGTGQSSVDISIKGDDSGSKAFQDTIARMKADFPKLNIDVNNLDTALNGLNKRLADTQQEFLESKVAADKAVLAAKGYTGSIEEMQAKLNGAQTAINEHRTLLQDISTILSGLFSRSWQTAKDSISGTIDFIRDVARDAITGLTADLERWIDAANKMPGVQKVLKALREGAHDLATAVQGTGAADIAPRGNTNTQQQIDDLKRHTEELAAHNAAMKEVKDRADAAAKADARFGEMIKGQISTVESYHTAAAKLAADIQNAVDHGMSRGAAMRLPEIVKQSKELMSAYREGVGSIDANASASEKLGKTIERNRRIQQEAEDHLLEYGNRVRALTRAFVDQTVGVDSLMAKNRLLGQVMASQGVTFESSTEKLRPFEPLIKEIVETAKKTGVLPANFKAMQAALDNLDFNAEEMTNFRKELQGVATISKEFGKDGRILIDAIAGIGGAAEVSDHWVRQNGVALMDYLDTAQNVDPVIAAIVDRYHALNIAQINLEQSSANANRRLEQQASFLNLLRDASREQATGKTDLTFDKLGRSSAEQQIRDSQIAANEQYQATKEAIQKILTEYSHQTDEVQNNTQEQTEIVIAGLRKQMVAQKVTADMQLAESLGVTKKIAAAWGFMARQIRDAWDAAVSVDSPGGAFVTPEEAARLNAMEKEFDRIRQQQIAILKIQQQWNEQLAILNERAQQHKQILNNIGSILSSIFGKDSGIGKFIEEQSAIASGMHDADTAVAQFSNRIGMLREKLKAGGKIELADIADLSQIGADYAKAIGTAIRSVGDMKSGLSKTLAGAQIGKELGGVVGAGIGFMLGGPLGAALGKKFGQLGGAVVGGIIAHFHKAEWEKVSKDVAKRFGASISDELAKSIAQTEKDIKAATRLNTGIGRATGMSSLSQEEIRRRAEVLNTSKIIEEQGGITAKNIKSVADGASTLLRIVADGGKLGKQALDELNSEFTQMSDFMDSSLNGIVTPSMLTFIDTIHQSGTEVKAVTDFLKKMADAALEAANAVTGAFTARFTKGEDLTKQINDLAKTRRDIVEKMQDLEKHGAGPGKSGKGQAEWEDLNRTLQETDKQFEKLKRQANGLTAILADPASTSQERFDRLGRLIEVTFNTAINSGKTFMESLKAIGPALAEMQHAAETAGYHIQDGLQHLIDLGQWADDNEEIANGITGLTNLMKTLQNQGMVTQTTFDDFGAEAQAQFNDIIASGQDSNYALELMAPTLQTLYELQQRFGYTVDESTQALINQGKEAGLVGEAHMSAQERMAASMDKVVDRLDVLLNKMFGIPIAADAAASGVEAAGGRMRGNADAVGEAVARAAGTFSGVGGAAATAAQVAAAELDRAREAADRLGYATGDVTDKFGGLSGAAAQTDAAQTGLDRLRKKAEELGLQLGDTGARYQTAFSTGAGTADTAESKTGDATSATDELNSTLDALIQQYAAATEAARIFGEEAYAASHAATYGHSPGGVDDLISHLNDAINSYYTLGSAASGVSDDMVEKMKGWAETLDDLNNQLTEESLDGLALQMFKLQEQKMAMIKKFMKDMEGASQEMIDAGLATIDQLFAKKGEKAAKAENERVSKTVDDARKQLTLSAKVFEQTLTFMHDGIQRTVALASPSLTATAYTPQRLNTQPDMTIPMSGFDQGFMASPTQPAIGVFGEKRPEMGGSVEFMKDALVGAMEEAGLSTQGGSGDIVLDMRGSTFSDKDAFIKHAKDELVPLLKTLLRQNYKGLGSATSRNVKVRT